MDDEKRNSEKPIPDNLDNILSEFQMMALRRIESFGWELQFVRRPPGHVPTPVIVSDDGKKIGILEDDGRINMSPDIDIRE